MVEAVIRVGSSRCPNCKEIKLFDSHKCKPLWWAFVENWCTEPQRVFASTADGAACKWAQQHESDTAEYSIASGDEEIVVLVYSQAQYSQGVEATECLAYKYCWDDGEGFESLEPPDGVKPDEWANEKGDEVDWLKVPHTRFRVAGEFVPTYFCV